MVKPASHDGKPMEEGVKRRGCVLLAVLVFCLICVVAAAAQDPKGRPPDQPEPVLLGNREVFVVRAPLDSYTPQERARVLTDRLKEIADDPAVAVTKTEVREGAVGSEIFIGGRLLGTVTDGDGRAEGLSRQELAARRAKEARLALESYRETRSLKSLLIAIGLALLATALFVVLLKITQRLKKTLSERLLLRFQEGLFKPLRYQKVEFLSVEQEKDIYLRAVKAASVAGYAVLIYAYLFSLFSILPWTRGYAGKLLGYILSPVGALGKGFLSQLPNLFTIIVLCVVARYLIKFIRFLFDEMRKGTIRFEGFYPEWVDPTYKLIRLVVLILTAVVIFPYIPGSDSAIFKGISIFVGVLFSLGSSTAVANVIAGLLMTYTRAFKIGDRIKVGDHVGDVVGKSLFTTKLRTIKNEHISVPNANMISTQIVNFSELAETEGLILHSTVTIGYDAPWRTIHKLLIDAALATEGILSQPEPFVLQTSLDDFYVSYQINAYTADARSMAVTYSLLHQNIQDAFNRGGVEIMSPHYRQLRDGNQTTIPGDYLGADYEAPRFRVDVKKEEP